MQILDRGTILNRMIVHMRSQDSEITYFGPGPVRAFLYAVATECQHLYYKLFQVEQRSDLMTASGSALDALARNRGLERLGASSSSVILTITASKATAFTSSFTLTNFQASTGGGQTFSVTGPVTFYPAYDNATRAIAKVVAESSATGTSQNVAIGTVTQVITGSYTGLPVGVTLAVNNGGPALGGSEAESDSQLRTRVAGLFAGLNQGTRGFYESQVREIAPEVTRVYVGRGSGLGQVKVFCATRSGAPLSGARKSEIEQTLGQRTPIQTYLSVEDMVFREIDIVFTTTLRSGYTLAQAAEQVGTAMSEYLDWSVWPFETAVQADDVLAICSTADAVDNLSVSSFSVLENVTLDRATLPRLGAVTLTDPSTAQTVTLDNFYNDYPRL